MLMRIVSTVWKEFHTLPLPRWCDSPCILPGSPSSSSELLEIFFRDPRCTTLWLPEPLSVKYAIQYLSAGSPFRFVVEDITAMK